MFVMHARGRLASQPELRFLGNGSAVCEFRLLDTRFTKGHEVVEAITMFCFDKLAEEFAGKVVKGQEIEATGTQETSEYAGPNGAKRTSIKYRMTWYHAGRKPAAARQQSDGGPGHSGRSDSAAAHRQYGAPSGAPQRPTTGEPDSGFGSAGHGPDSDEQFI